MQKERNDGERKTTKIRMKLKKKRIDKEKLKNGQNQQIKKRRPKRKEQRIRQESDANRSYQKVLGTRLKDRKCKQRDKDTPKRKWKTSNSCKDYSTPRVQPYREKEEPKFIVSGQIKL